MGKLGNCCHDALQKADRVSKEINEYAAFGPSFFSTLK